MPETTRPPWETEAPPMEVTPPWERAPEMLAPQKAPISFEALAQQPQPTLPNPELTTGIPFVDWPAGVVDATIAGTADMGSLLVGSFKGAAKAYRGEIIGTPDGMYRLETPMEVYSREATRGQDLYHPATEAGSIMYNFMGKVLGKFMSTLGDLAYNRGLVGMFLPSDTPPGAEQPEEAGSPMSGAVGAAVGAIIPMVLGHKLGQKIKGVGGEPGFLDILKGTPAADANASVWAHYFKQRFPQTYEMVQKSAVGKVRMPAKGSVWRELDIALNEELKPLDVGDMSVRQKMLTAFHKFDPKGEVPLETKQKLVEKYLENLRELEIATKGKMSEEVGIGTPDVVDKGTDVLKIHREQLKTEPVLDTLPKVLDAGQGKVEPTIGPEPAAPAVIRNRRGPSGKQQGAIEGPSQQELVDLAARLGRALDDPILPYVAAGLVRPAPGDGLIRVYKPTSLRDDVVKAGDTVYTNPDVAAEQASLRSDAVGGGSVVSAEVPAGEVFKYGSNKYVHAPAGTNISMLPQFMERETGKITTMGDMLKQSVKPSILPGGTPAAAQKMRSIYDQSRAAEEQLYKHYQRKIGRELHTAMIDHAGEVKGALLAASGQEGRNAVREFELIAGTPVKAMRRYRTAYADIFQGLDSGEMATLDEVLNSRRIIQIDTYKGPGKVKHLGGATGEDAKIFLNDMRSKDPKRFDKLNAKADQVFSVYKTQLDEMLKEGLITPESYKKMANFDYEPRRYLDEFLDDIDPVTAYDRTVNPLSVRDSGIQDIKQGSKDFQILNSRALLAETISRSQSRIAKNRANKALLEFATTHKDAEFVKAPDASKFEWNERGDLKTSVKVPAGYVRIDAKVNGQAHPIFLQKWLAEQWASRPKAMVPIVEGMIRFVSGTALVRPLATTYNPAFALTNLPRDMITAWMNTDTWSPHLPVTLGQMSLDYFNPEVLKGTFGRRGDLLDRYFEEGGGQDFLTHQGRRFLSSRQELPGEMQTRNPRVEQVKDFLSYLNESSELWTRLAMTRRLEASGMSSRDAVWQSRRWLDYAQGGVASKGIDTFIPFFNASMQAWRGTFRQAKEKPVEYAEKLTWMAGIMAYNTVSQIMADPNGWREMSTSDKINRMTIWTGQYTTDDKGNKRRMYVTLPIDNQLIPLKALMVGIAEKQMFGKVPDDVSMKALSQMSQLIPAGQFPTPMANALGGYWANHDFWRDDKIWKEGNVSPYMEYVAGGKDPTPEIWKQFGSITGFSPEKSRYFSRALVPDNAWMDLASMGWQRTFGEVPPGAAELTDMEIMARAPFAKRVVKLTHPINREVDEVPKFIQAENDRQKLQNDAVSVMLQQNRGNLWSDVESPAFKASVDSIGDWISKQPQEDQGRLAKNVIYTVAFDSIMRKIKTSDDVPSRYFWMNTADADPQARAAAYYDRWVNAGPEGRQQMEQIAGGLHAVGSKLSARLKQPVSGYTSEAFLREFAKLKEQRGTAQR